MDFDLTALLRQNESKHKSRPTQFVSVAGGIQKRLETNLRTRKSNRLTVFDNVRNLERVNSLPPKSHRQRVHSPPPKSDAQLKQEHRKQQLEKWKEEKEKKKKEAAFNKKKPFLAGQSKYVPPPPKSSLSGRVTRAQSKPNTLTVSLKSNQNIKSFAPANATFKPPEIKTLTKLPTLKQPKCARNKKTYYSYTFEPVLPITDAPRVTRSKTYTDPKSTGSKTNAQQPRAAVVKSQSITLNQIDKTTKAKVAPKANVGSKVIPSSSSNNIEVHSNKRCLRNTKPANSIYYAKTASAMYTQTTTSISDMESSKVKSIATPKAKLQQKKALSSKVHVINSTYTEQSSDSSGEKVNIRRRSFRKSVFPKTGSESTDNKTILPHNKTSSTTTYSKEEHSEVTNSEVDFISENSSEESAVFKPVSFHIHTPKAKMIPRSESSSEEKLRSPNSSEVITPFSTPRSPKDPMLTPEQVEKVKKISPRVTLSRGKENARKEMKWKLNEGLLDEDTVEMESVTHFRKQLSCEIERMTAMCDDWDKIFQQTVLPEPVQELVLSAVGQARLLMSQKLQQFASLIERCARPEPGTALVTPADLHGFWDMVYMQVENVDIRFNDLEVLRAKNWVEDKPPQTVKVAAKPRGVFKKVAKPAATSRIRDMIAAARKAKNNVSSPEKLAPEEKHFEAGFFSVRSPVRCSTGPKSPHTPQGGDLYRAVLSSEAKKASQASASRNSASFAMLRASLMSKKVECEGIAPLPQTPECAANFATPGRSILKSTNKNVTKSSKKSIKLVLFDDRDEDLDSSLNNKSIAKDITEMVADIDTDIQDRQHTNETVTDSGTSSMDGEKSDEKKPIQKSRKLTRQDAVFYDSPSQLTSETALDNDENVEIVVKTPRRSTRKPKPNTEVKAPQSGRKNNIEIEVEVEVNTPRRAKIKALQEMHANVRPMRSRKSAPTAL